MSFANLALRDICVLGIEDGNCDVELLSFDLRVFFSL